MINVTNIIDVYPLLRDSGSGYQPIYHEYPIYPSAGLVSTSKCRRHARAVHYNHRLRRNASRLVFIAS